MPIQNAPTSMPVDAMMQSVNSGDDFAEHQRNGNDRGSKAAEHERAFAADDHQADARRQRDAERGQDQRRRALQGILQRERRAESAALDELEKFDRRLSERQQEQREQQRRDPERQQRDDDVFGATTNAGWKDRPNGWTAIAAVGSGSAMSAMLCYELPDIQIEAAESHPAVRRAIASAARPDDQPIAIT